MSIIPSRAPDEQPAPNSLEGESELPHELGKALAAISAHAQLLFRRLPAWPDAPVRRALVAIRDGLLRASRLLRPVPVGFPPTCCDLPALVALALSQVPPERVPDLRVRVRAATPMIVRGQPERIVQVLANLLDNGVKYSLPGTLIEIETSRVGDGTGDWAQISVRDEGIGIDTAASEIVFAGHRTSAARRTAPGDCLGLALSRRLVEAEGGQLWVTGMPGCGSTCYVQLPLAAEAADEPAGAAPPGSSVHGARESVVVLSPATRIPHAAG
jgi:signal transduction histidine kinase